MKYNNMPKPDCWACRAGFLVNVDDIENCADGIKIMNMEDMRCGYISPTSLIYKNSKPFLCGEHPVFECPEAQATAFVLKTNGKYNVVVSKSNHNKCEAEYSAEHLVPVASVSER